MGFENFIKKTLNESILDKERKTLCDEVWKGKILKKEVKEIILNRLSKFLEKFALNKAIISNILIVGSITGYRYNESSDIDVNVALKVSDDKLNEIWEKVSDVNEKNLEGTKHPINFYFLKDGTELTTGDFRYDVLNDKWIKPPKRIEIKGVDFNNLAMIITSQCYNIDLTFGELKRDFLIYNLFKKDYDEIHNIKIDKKDVDANIKKYAEEILSDIDAICVIYDQLHFYRGMAFGKEEDKTTYIKQFDSDIKDNNIFMSNIIWKHLEVFGYIKKLKEIKKIAKLIKEESKNKLSEKIEKDLEVFFK